MNTAEEAHTVGAFAAVHQSDYLSNKCLATTSFDKRR